MRRLLLIVPIMLAACSQRPVAIPRPEAFPRVETYPADYHAVEIPPLTIAVNDSADFKRLSDDWFNIYYPAYPATVNATILPYSPDVIANRLERMNRDLGGSSSTIVELPRGFVSVAPTALQTPIHFLATDSANWVISGVAVCEFSPRTSPDSVAPIIDALAVDIITLVNNL